MPIRRFSFGKHFPGWITGVATAVIAIVTVVQVAPGAVPIEILEDFLPETVVARLQNVTALEMEIANLKEDLQESQGSAITLGGISEDRRDKIVEHLDAIAEKEVEVTEWKSKYGQLEIELEEWKGKYTTIETRNQQLDKSLQDWKDRSEDLRGELDSLGAQFSNTESERESLARRNLALIDERDSLSTERDLLEIENSDLRNELVLLGGGEPASQSARRVIPEGLSDQLRSIKSDIQMMIAGSESSYPALDNVANQLSSIVQQIDPDGANSNGTIFYLALVRRTITFPGSTEDFVITTDYSGNTGIKIAFSGRTDGKWYYSGARWGLKIGERNCILVYDSEVSNGRHKFAYFCEG